MAVAFLDTSGWFAALSPKEASHRAARKVYASWIEGGVRLVTTNLVIAEMHILITRFRGGDDGVRFLDSVHQDATHDVVFVDRKLERAAIDHWLRRFADQRLSLADAVSFEVMRARGIKQVLALDAHFTLAGFDLEPPLR